MLSLHQYRYIQDIGLCPYFTAINSTFNCTFVAAVLTAIATIELSFDPAFNAAVIATFSIAVYYTYDLSTIATIWHSLNSTYYAAIFPADYATFEATNEATNETANETADIAALEAAYSTADWSTISTDSATYHFFHA